jgi:hypothetical protein
MQSPTSGYNAACEAEIEILESCLRDTPHINGRRIFPSINGLDGNQNANLRRDLNQAPGSQKARLRPARSGAVVPFHAIRIRPRGPSTSIVHSRVAADSRAISSTKAGGVVDTGLAVGCAGVICLLSFP